ncbi:MAG TPA: bifunctional phosphoribosylaminoimidazolecarboxamide formyltransferase/IMP cyclohydrolase, partial [Chloroflexia bacterium]|nr:bifunctional phosphoribosylaminoimidazolecarboxamide formyltransferase/IMP cyclohydrolase [Chloroflexia bacterium]
MKAILSVSDRTGLVELAQGLVELGVELIATGGTRAHLEAAGPTVTGVDTLTGFPEILEGRVKTLHPAVYGGLLARRDRPDDLAQLDAHGLGLIDLVVVNLYPFRETIARPGVSMPEALENIDIGGPSLLRAAAKNFPAVLPLCDPADYGPVLAEWQQGAVSQETRRRLAARAFQHVAAYDTAVAAYLRGTGTLFPPTATLALHKVQDLRYGENPHQAAALYRIEGQRSATLAESARQLQGKELSYNNLLDADGALALVREVVTPTVVIVKHANPCGVASRDDLREAFDLALAGDPVSAFGGIVGINRPVDGPLAEALTTVFFEVIVAPAFDADALRILGGKKNLRVIAVPMVEPQIPDTFGAALTFRTIDGGLLIQAPDHIAGDEGVPMHPQTSRHPTLPEISDLLCAWRVASHVKSNAIVLAKDRAVIGVGGGQPSRVDSVKIAVGKAGWRAEGSALASDAFFPFPDGVEEAAKAGVAAIIQPGGSLNDASVIAAAEAAGLAMVFTGQ